MNIVVERPAPPPGHRLRRLPLLLVVWPAVIAALIAAGALDGSLVGTLATLVLIADTALFTKLQLQ